MDPFLQQRHYWHDADEAPFVPGSIAGESGGVRHDLDQERRRVERINRLIQDISTKMGMSSPGYHLIKHTDNPTLFAIGTGQGGDGHASVGRNKVCHYLDGKNEKLTLEQPIQGLDRKLGMLPLECLLLQQN